MKEITADISKAVNKNDQGRYRDKERIRVYHVAILAQKSQYRREMQQIVTFELLRSRSRNASTVYCAFWAHNKAGDWFGASGSAGGYGYDKASAAVGDALRNAGVQLSEGIWAVGEQAIIEALWAVANTLGYDPQDMFQVII